MTMDVDTVVVLYVSSKELQRFSNSEIAAPDGWLALVGDNGATFYGRALDDALLIMPTMRFDSSEQLARHLRDLLGATLEMHIDLRGMLVTSAESAQGQSYQDVVTNCAGTGIWVLKEVEHDASTQAAGWSFADAARTFASPGTRTRVDTQPKEAALDTTTAGAEPLDAADSKFGAIFATKNERGALRRTLSAALDHSLDASLLGSIVGSSQAPADDESTSPLAGMIRRNVSSDPNAMDALEASLRDAVDSGLKDDSEKTEPSEAIEETS